MEPNDVASFLVDTEALKHADNVAKVRSSHAECDSSLFLFLYLAVMDMSTEVQTAETLLKLYIESAN